MTRQKFEAIGIVLKFRTTADGFVTATVWFDDEPRVELARLWVEVSVHPGDPLYITWRESVQNLFNAWLRRVTGEEAIVTRLRAPKDS